MICGASCAYLGTLQTKPTSSTADRPHRCSSSQGLNETSTSSEGSGLCQLCLQHAQFPRFRCCCCRSCKTDLKRPQRGPTALGIPSLGRFICNQLICLRSRSRPAPSAGAIRTQQHNTAASLNGCVASHAQHAAGNVFVTPSSSSAAAAAGATAQGTAAEGSQPVGQFQVSMVGSTYTASSIPSCMHKAIYL